MRKILFTLLFLAVGMTANAQYNKGYLELQRRGQLAVNGIPLAQDEIQDFLGNTLYEMYVPAYKKYVSGKRFEWIGLGTWLGCEVLNAYFRAPYMQDGKLYIDLLKEDKAAYTGALITGLGTYAGLGMLIGGAIDKYVGKGNLKNLVRAYNYNAGGEISASFGAAPSGLGLTVRF